MTRTTRPESSATGRFREWLHGWRITWSIRLFDRTAWKILTSPGDEDDYVEVERPSQSGGGAA